MDGISLGRLFDAETGEVGDKATYTGGLHCVVLGPTGCGKSVRLLAQNLLRPNSASILVIDPSGEQAAMTAAYRRTLGKVAIINPFAVLTDRVGYGDLRSTGFNPLATLEPASSSFNVRASLISEATIPVSSKDPFWETSARALSTAVIMYTVIEARRLGRVPTMARVRELLCMASDRPHKGNDDEGAGIPKLAREMMCSNIAALRNKASQFLDWSKEVQSIASVAKSHTEAFDDSEIVQDMSGLGFDLSEMKRSIVTIYLILPPGMMERHSKWLRIITSTAIQTCMRPREPGEPHALFILDEAAALGNLETLSAVWPQARKYGLQFMPIFQDIHQIKSIYGDKWETFISNAGIVASFTPNDMTTAKWLSERAGDMTIVSASYNENESTSNGPPKSGETVGKTGENSGKGFTFGQSKVPLLPAHDLLGLQKGCILVAAAGFSNLIPIYAPAYYQIRTCNARARKNPYYHQVPRYAAIGHRSNPTGGWFDPAIGYGVGAEPMTVRVKLGGSAFLE